MDLLGMKFTGHPKPKRLILADDWPDGIYPLRKEVPYNLDAAGGRGRRLPARRGPAGLHRSFPSARSTRRLHEPAHFAVYVDGETIKGCDYRGFMIHRGIEKLCQTQAQLQRGPLHRRADLRHLRLACTPSPTPRPSRRPRASSISRRAEYIRTIMLEIERLHSPPALARRRRPPHRLRHASSCRPGASASRSCGSREKITGNRKTYGMVVIGGVRRDITPEIADRARGHARERSKRSPGHPERRSSGDTRHPQADQGRRRPHKEETMRWSLVGPVARARGRRHRRPARPSLRRLRRHEVRRPGRRRLRRLGHACVVRVLEIFESIEIIRQAPGQDAGRRPHPDRVHRGPAARSGTPCPWSRRRAASRSTT
ncbi:MAG: NADH-quinone oxidoreductase subunit C [Candidatus Moduliflexus flocculans]|nr:NADH-quinone oxidoreductase subunit C [Candidatus Moduliflexus flocculans]